MPWRKLIRILLSLLIVGLFLLYSAGALPVPVLHLLENFAYDTRLRATMPNTMDDRIIIADLDEESLSQIGHWPWSRDKLANLMDALFDHYQIKVVGFDMIFAEVDQDRGLEVLEQLSQQQLKEDQMFQRAYQHVLPTLQFDQQFSRSIENRHVVLGFVFNNKNRRQTHALPQPFDELPASVSSSLDITRPQGFTANLPLIQQEAAAAGFLDNPIVDSDGRFRRVPILQEYQGKLYASLALTVARLALDAEPSWSVKSYGAGVAAIHDFTLGPHPVPLDHNAALLVPYRGVQGSFPYYSISDILNRSVPLEDLKDRIVLIGTTAPGLLDLHSTPVQNTYPGVEVHANILSGILDGRIKHKPALVITIVMAEILGLGLLMTFVTSRLQPIVQVIFIITMVALAIVGNLWAWQHNWVLPLAPLLCMIALLFLLQMGYGFLVEARTRRAITKLFGQYIPSELVNEMADNPDSVNLEGQSREMTVLFSDIRGFTSISEGLGPQELSSLMNHFLTPMTHIIHQNRGTIDKYMGDAIMAFWGAPLDDQDHARNALWACYAMVRKVEELEEPFAQRGWPPLRIGVGVNTGMMNVGNMGSEFRMAYTVMGDAVNLGARLEGLTKQYGVSIIVSESTRNAVPDFLYRQLDCVRVKGKAKPVTIYEPVAPHQQLSTAEHEHIDRFHTALDAYRQQHWDEAYKIIQSLVRDDGKRLIYEIYLDRIHLYRHQPPGSNWDGVFTHTIK